MIAPAPYWSDDRVSLYLGDCEKILPGLPADSVDAIVTDPRSGRCLMADPKPSLYELWKQAGGGTGTYSGERYRDLMIEHGLLLLPGDEGYEQASPTLPCGWPGPPRRPRTCARCLWDITEDGHGRWRLAWTDTDDGAPDPYRCDGDPSHEHAPKEGGPA